MDISATTGTMPRRTESLHTLWHARLTRGKVVELTFTFPTSPSEAYFDSTSLTYCGVLRYFVHAALLHSSYFDKGIWNGEGETYSVRHINYECLGHWTSSFNQIVGVSDSPSRWQTNIQTLSSTLNGRAVSALRVGRTDQYWLRCTHKAEQGKLCPTSKSQDQIPAELLLRVDTTAIELSSWFPAAKNDPC